MPESSTTVQQVSAEVLGTFVLVFFGCGTALMSGGDYVATALAFGLTVLVMAYAVGRVSGAHFNPAITLGAAVGGRIAWRQVPVYIGAQLVGALAAGLCLFVLMHGFPGFDATGNMAQNSFGDAGSGYAWWAALLAGDADDGGVPLGDPRRDGRPQRAPGARPARDRPDPDDAPLRVDRRHRHLGQPGAFHRGRRLRRRGRDRTALALHPGPAPGWGDRRHHLRAAVRPRSRGRAWLRPEVRPHPDCSRSVAPGVAAPGVGAVPGYGAPDQLQEQWNPETDEGQPPS